MKSEDVVRLRRFILRQQMRKNKPKNLYLKMKEDQFQQDLDKANRDQMRNMVRENRKQ